MLKLRSFLFSPGNNPRRIEKALNLECDAVIVDLEDSIPLQEKKNVRDTLRDYLNNVSFSKTVYLRINDLKTNFWEEDVSILKNCQFDGIVLPKAESKGDVLQVVEEIQSFGLASEFDVIPLIESAKGVQSAYEIAISHSSVTTILFGSIDYALDIGCELSEDGTELLFARSSLVNAARAAGIRQIIDSVYPHIEKEQGLLNETQLAKKLGYTGKMVIHPKQIAVVNRVFNYTEEELNQARKVVELFEEAEKQGIAAIQFQNQMIDYPVYKKAKDILLKVN